MDVKTNGKAVWFTNKVNEEREPTLITRTELTITINDKNYVIVANPERRYVFDKEKMGLVGLKITWVCIVNFFCSCSIFLYFEYKNITFLLFPKHLVFTSIQTDNIGKKTS